MVGRIFITSEHPCILEDAKNDHNDQGLNDFSHQKRKRVWNNLVYFRLRYPNSTNPFSKICISH